jgi:adenine-specific DNA-methyltransferase
MIRLYNDDCLEILPRLPEKSVDLVITSPPYDMNKEYEKVFYDWEKLMLDCIDQLIRIVSTDGSICFQIGNRIIGTGRTREVIPLDLFFYDQMIRRNWLLRNRIIWTFGHGLHNKHSFSGRYETILWFTYTGAYKFNLDDVRIPQKYPNKRHYKGENKGKLSGNPLGKNPSDVWKISNVKHNHPEKTDHPCQFPEELVKRLVLGLTDIGDIVLDPFMGSGTVGKVCKDLGRNFIGVEKEIKYFEIAKERI